MLKYTQTNGKVHLYSPERLLNCFKNVCMYSFRNWNYLIINSVPDLYIQGRPTVGFQLL